MCYRFFLRKSELNRACEALKAALRAEFSDQVNIAPSSSIAVARREPSSETPVVSSLRWGLVPAWAATPESCPPSLANARADTLAAKPSFAESYRKRRCLIPAGGFFEWETLPGGRKQPWLFHRRDGAPLLFAGIWDRWTGADGRSLESCAIVTTNPSADIADLHDRMPVCLDLPSAVTWLAADTAGSSLEALLRPAADRTLDRFRVDPRINSVRFSDPACLAPWSPPPPSDEPQLSLGLD
ncbi:putative SOS response-associated peptidase YedK [mine drainage metagenome]|uniref:Putative SOS response-associated peptidase YedK n=1 Tax=mine drainage metagenome TaxID=410659 RepID=A0A1J5SB19_9ZZZZ